MQLGHPDDMHRRREVTRPDGETVVLWLTPSEARWDYIPEPPYRIVRFDTSGLDGRHYHAWEEDLSEEAMYASFVTRHLPRPWQATEVTDAHFQVALAWVHDGSQTTWQGCARAFELLAVAHNPIDAALWYEAAQSLYEARHTMESETWQRPT